MTLQEVKQELEVFNKFKFFEEGHYYKCNGKDVGISVTRLIEEYSNPFDQQGIAEKVAIKNQQIIDRISKDRWHTEEDFELLNKILIDKTNTVQGNLDLWKRKNELACEKGHFSHEFAQSLWSSAIYQESIKSNLESVKMPLESIKQQARNFYNDFKDKFTHIQDEQLVGSEEYDIASAVDHLFLDNEGNVWLIDYKTNSILKGYNDDEKNRRYTKKMLIPLQNIKDDSLNHYYLQLSIYKYLIEKYTNIKIYKTMIVYMSENIENYELIETPYLKNEVEKILKLRRANKMAKMLLIIGEGGSGKTSSLKNLSPKEHFYIDCDKKGLNYKGWKEDYIEKKNYYKTNDGEVVAKLLHEISNNKPDFKYVTIDTINSIMIADEMKRMKGKSYNEWQDLAKCIFDLIDIVPDLRDDLTVIFIGHTQTEEDGFTRLLTNGRKLNKIGLEKYFNTVLLSKARDGEYIFETRANNSTARTPMGAFDELEIPNDITKVLEVIKDY